MPRRPRLEFPSATYHVFGRGNRREKIFLDDQDYKSYLNTLRELSAKSGVEVIAYCLMPNHPHLALRTHRLSLSKFMQRVNSRHANRFNRRHAKCGHLYQGRYRAIVVDSEAYLFKLVRYIHQNPPRAGLVPHVGNWPYSSHGQYLEPSSAWVSPTEVLSKIGGPQGYLALMGEPSSPEDAAIFSGASDGFRMACASEDALKLGAWAIMSSVEPERWESTSNRRVLPSEEIEDAANRWALDRGIMLSELQGSSQREPLRTVRRELAASLRNQGHLVRQSARLLCREEAAVSRLVARAADRVGLH
ncbi:MAG: transposase [Myxococcaceae bacterium]